MPSILAADAEPLAGYEILHLVAVTIKQFRLARTSIFIHNFGLLLLRSSKSATPAHFVCHPLRGDHP
jgi:hypothetical protein